MPKDNTSTTRRAFLKKSTGIAVGATLAGTLVVPRSVHAGASEKMRIGLIGCGGRGTAAAENALVASPENVLVAVGRCVCRLSRTASLDKLRRNEA